MSNTQEVPWAVRLYNERDELKIKHDKLYDFIGSKQFKNNLTYTQRVALEIQMLYMKGYLDTLRFRIEEFSVTCEGRSR